jgi:hypothetical protein
MELRLVPSPDDGVAEAARRAAAEVASVGEAAGTRGRWWAAGLEDAVAGRAVTPARGPVYDVALSPRSTRGATRA